MDSGHVALLSLDLLGTLAFAVNGAMTALRYARVDIVGVLTLGMVTALGGGFIRDILIDSLPPTTFQDWRYLLTAAVGSLLAFFLGPRLERLAPTINLFDAVGLSLFAVIGTLKGLAFGLGPVQSIILGVITAAGGGTIRDIMIQRIPAVLHTELYAIPAALAAGLTVLIVESSMPSVPWVVIAALICFVLRMVGIHFDLHAPKPPHFRKDT
ncbi:trimeric intracellular cation channel family protein [Jonesia quinghaiensis]|uniref:trimeric intracellular cation channel family protein n=1 Tax=Jonesia quinghaiensis TaxID=262806 RepID=UPI00041099A7|nr:trimeric intracellular cation channel family protein [Jonesia quinghaiensis]